MRVLESAPDRYGRGIRLLLLGRIDSNLHARCAVGARAGHLEKGRQKNVDSRMTRSSLRFCRWHSDGDLVGLSPYRFPGG